MQDIESAKIAMKVEKGEELTQDEKIALMSEPPEDYDKRPGEDEDIFKDAIDLDKEKKETEDASDKGDATVPEKDQSNEPEKKEEPESEAKKEEVKEPEPEKKEEPAKEDFVDRLNRELDKPEGREDLKDFSDREKAYFWQMRRDRRARQKAEEERDLVRLERLKDKAKEAEKKEPELPPEEVMFKDRDPEEFITIKDVKNILKSERDRVEMNTPPPPDPVRVAYLRMCDAEAAKQFPDYAEVLACTDDIVRTNPKYQAKVMEALETGKNPAVVIYQLIKGDPEFPTIVERLKTEGKMPAPKEEAKKEPTPDEAKKAAEAKKAQEKLEENKNKPKTSGHAGGSESAPGEISLEQVAKMSDKEFARLPKATREKYLKLFGV